MLYAPLVMLKCRFSAMSVIAIFLALQIILLIIFLYNINDFYIKSQINNKVSKCRGGCLDVNFDEVDVVPSANSLVLPIVVFRHGDRAPEVQEIYKCDPYASESEYWPAGYGNLLKKGRQRLYTLGKFYRLRYKSFLPTQYNAKDINITSSDMDRTIMSAQCVLAGLYLPQNFDFDRTKDIVAPVIPVHSLNRNNDLYIRFKKECDRYGHELDRIREEKYNDTLTYDMEYVYKYLAKYTCQNVTSIQTVNRIHTTLQIEQDVGYQIPEYFKGPEYPKEQVEYIGALTFTVRAYNDLLKRLAGGPLLTRIIDHMTEKKNKTLDPDYKMIMYSGHDTTIAILLRTLGYHKMVKPDFGSSLIFELHLIHGQYYVQVYFKPNGASTQMILLEFLQCHLVTQCTLEEFIRLNEPWRIHEHEWEEECKIK